MPENLVWVAITNYLGWSLSLSAFFFALVSGGTLLLAKQHRESFSLWLMGAQEEVAWTDSFCRVFDRIFGESHFSIRCIAMSTVFSAATVLLIWWILGPILGVLEHRTATSVAWWKVMLWGILINFLPDYLSLFQTRKILEWFRHVRSTSFQFFLIMLDALISAAIIWVGVIIFVWVFGDPFAAKENVTGAEMVAIVSPYAIFFYSTFFTSIWAWVYWSATAVLRLFTRLGLNRLLDVEESPGASVGAVGSVIILVVCFTFGQLLTVKDGKIVTDETLCGWFPELCDDFARLSVEEELQLTFLTMACEGGVTDQCLQTANRQMNVDNAVAARLWAIACENGEMSGCQNLGYLYTNGTGVDKDNVKAMMLFAKACDGGDAIGCGNLGIAFREGLGTEFDEARATQLFTQACVGGYTTACANLGIARLKGRGVAQDLALAERLLTYACENGVSASCVNLGVAYQSGSLGTGDASRASGLFSQACENGDLAGCGNLGLAYQGGYGVVKDISRAEELFTDACEAGDEANCRHLSLLKLLNVAYEVDFPRIAVFLSQACEDGEAESCRNLGHLYENGAGVAKDLIRAAQFFAMACDGGDGAGCGNLGLSYRHGSGVSSDETRAQELFVQACNGVSVMPCLTEGSAFWSERLKYKIQLGDFYGAEAALNEALTYLPDDPSLLWSKAIVLEVIGDMEGAIQIYEQLYENRYSADMMGENLINNLASLLATYRDDDESLERAWMLVRGLELSTHPAKQDTFGWILFRRGAVDEALPYLEAAAAGLPADPIVQFHLAQAYFFLDRRKEALTKFRDAIKASDATDTRAQLIEARRKIELLENIQKQ